MLLAMTTDVSGAVVEPFRSPVLPVVDAPAQAIQRDRFRWEADMTATVAGQVQRLMPRGGGHLVAGEVPAARGIAANVAVRFDTGAVRRRLAAGVGPVTSPLRVQVLHLLRSDRGTRAATLAARLRTNAPALTRSTRRPLAESGLVERDGDMVRSTGAWCPVPAHITAVELKLSKWRDALRQADNFAASADRSWVVLDEARSGAVVREISFFAAFGVGLAVVAPTGDLRVILPPRGRRPEPWLRSLMAEQAWATAEPEVAFAFGAVLQQRAPAVEVTRLDTRGGRRGESVAKRDRAVKAVRDELPALSDRDCHQGRGLLGRLAKLVALREREVVRATHLDALGAGAWQIAGLVHELLVDAPRHASQELRLEIGKRSLLRGRHGRGEPVDPRASRHAPAEAPGAPPHGKPPKPA